MLSLYITYITRNKQRLLRKMIFRENVLRIISTVGSIINRLSSTVAIIKPKWRAGQLCTGELFSETPPLIFIFFEDKGEVLFLRGHKQSFFLALWSILHGAYTLRGHILTPFPNPKWQIQLYQRIKIESFISRLLFKIEIWFLKIHLINEHLFCKHLVRLYAAG